MIRYYDNIRVLDRGKAVGDNKGAATGSNIYLHTRFKRKCVEWVTV